MSCHNLPAGGAARDYYERIYGGDEGPDLDEELNLESLYDTARPEECE